MQNRDLPCKLRSKNASPDLVLSPPRAITLTSAHLTPLADLGLCVFWMKHFSFFFLACLCKITACIHESNTSSSSHFVCQPPTPNAAVPLCRPRLVFRGPAWGSFCLGATQLHAAPCRPHTTLFSLGLFGGRLGLCGLVFWACLVFRLGFWFFFAFYFLSTKRSRENCKKQVKEEELELKLCLVLSLI